MSTIDVPLAAVGLAMVCVGAQVCLWFAKRLILDAYFARKARRIP